MVGTFRNGAYDALVEALKTRRESLGLSQIAVVARLPQWLGFDHTMLSKVEHKTRDVSHIEARELASALQLALEDLDAMAKDLEKARSNPVPSSTSKALAQRALTSTARMTTLSGLYSAIAWVFSGAGIAVSKSVIRFLKKTSGLTIVNTLAD
jgi:transcriptional regulator with XRE-family HTH domain